MYNAIFLPQLDEFRRQLFGSRSPRDDFRDGKTILQEKASRRYVLPNNMDTIPCELDINREYVPINIH